jgi:hypothetical protein
VTNFRKVNVILQGPTGSGKTFSLKSLVEAGLELFVIPTEPGIENVLGDLPTEKCHWHYIPPATPDWDTMLKSANAINTMTQDILQKSDGNRGEYRQFIEFLDCCSNFKCDRTGKEYGAVDDFDTTRVLAVDGMSGLSIMAMDLVAGNKPAKTMADWGMAMDNLERLITKLACATKCSFVLTAHQDREMDEISGGTTVTVSTLGRKLAPKIPRFFDEVVQTVRDGKDFKWSTAESGSVLKARILPISDALRPDFGQIFT